MKEEVKVDVWRGWLTLYVERSARKDGEVGLGEAYRRGDTAPCKGHEKYGWKDDWKPAKTRRGGVHRNSMLVSTARISDKRITSEHFLTLDFKAHLVDRHDLRVKSVEFYDKLSTKFKEM